LTVSLDIRDLVLEFPTRHGRVRALDGLTLSVDKGEILGVVGESGSGKSTAGFAIGRLLPKDVHISGNGLKVFGQDILSLDKERLRQLRRDHIRYIFQDPIATLDPTIRIGKQVALAAVPRLSQADVLASLEEVGLKDPQRVSAAWPHELSGGMAQRVVIAMALLGHPRLIIADEATSALDATVRNHILDLLRKKSRERDITLLLLSHDLWAVREYCRTIAVMYAGRVVEYGPTADVFARPVHPYTRALLQATPGREAAGAELQVISGTPPVLRGPSPGCAFAPRCAHAQQTPCLDRRPLPDQVRADHSVLCMRWRELPREETAYQTMMRDVHHAGS
jgi:peptide/nickel transport system ATP-binding protein